jgi:hypothetical protein
LGLTLRSTHQAFVHPLPKALKNTQGDTLEDRQAAQVAGARIRRLRRRDLLALSALLFWFGILQP